MTQAVCSYTQPQLTHWVKKSETGPSRGGEAATGSVGA